MPVEYINFSVFTDPLIITVGAGVFLLAGLVKGVIGLGLPTVSLGLLVGIFDLTTAIALMLVPSFVTNVWQATLGGHAIAITRRIWPFLLMVILTISLGASALSRVPLPFLSALLGGLLVLYATLSLAGLRLQLSPHQGRWLGPLCGGINGVLTGMTGSFVVPGVMYLQAVGLTRDELVQAMGILFTVSSVVLALALRNEQIFTWELGVTSAIATLPAAVGMLIGQRLRGKLSQSRFRQLFFGAVLSLGSYVMINALSSTS